MWNITTDTTEIHNITREYFENYILVNWKTWKKMDRFLGIYDRIFKP